MYTIQIVDYPENKRKQYKYLTDDTSAFFFTETKLGELKTMSGNMFLCSNNCGLEIENLARDVQDIIIS